MQRIPLFNYMIPSEMEQYLSFFGPHFNKKLCDYAVSLMEKKDGTTGVTKKVVPMTMEELNAVLTKNKVDIDKNDIYDALYLANMVKADFWGSSIEDDEHLANYIDDVICDVDGYDGIVFCRFLADCSAKGLSIYWDLMV